MPAETTNKEYQFVSRVTNYPVVHSVWEYYASVKEKSSLLKYGCETVETNLEKSIKWVAPKVEPVLQSDLVKTSLVKMDEIGCKQLDNIETTATTLADSYQSSKKLIEHKATVLSNDIKATTVSLVEASKKSIVPVDNYLKDSVLALPYNTALNVTEKVCDSFLPKEEEEEGETDKSTTQEQEQAGPIVRTGKLSVRIQKEAFRKLKDLSLRTPEQINAMKYSVDLIKYAATQIDNGAKLANTFVNEGVEKSTAVVKSVVSKQQQTTKEVRQRINVVTKDAIAALTHAVEIISKQVPAPITNASHQTLEAIREKSKSIEHLKDLAHFDKIATQSLAKLNDASAQLTTYLTSAAHKTEAYLPPQLVASVTTTLTTVLDILSVVVNKKNRGSTSSTSSGSESSESTEEISLEDH